MHSISNVNIKARKKHICNSWEFIRDDKHEKMCVDYVDDGYQCHGIKIGDIYNRQVNVDGGDLWTFKSCLPCIEYVKVNKIDMTGDR